MKFQVQFIYPDTLHDAIREAVKANVKAMPGLDEEEAEAVIEKRAEKAREWAGHWFRYREYVVLECDTDADTVTVIKGA